MGSVHHANAKTRARIRKEIQDSKESIAVLAKRLSLNPKTVLKWRHAGRVEDAKSGPTNPRSTVLSEQEEQVICEFRRVTKFSLDDVLISLRDLIPALTRSNLHRCLKRHGLSRLPKEELKRPKKKFKDYDIGYVHIDITTLHIGKKKWYLFVGIDRVCKYCYVELYERMTQKNARLFLENLNADFPFKIHTILTDNGAQFTYALLVERLRPKTKIHIFDQYCQSEGIEHRLTKFRHPWTNGQVEVMNRVIKAHTPRRYFYENVEELKKHLMAFILFYNYQRPLRALKFKTPYEKILEIYETDKTLFKVSPNHKIIGLNN